MKLWLLRPVRYDLTPWGPQYAKVFGFVIRAKTEQRARECAADLCGEEGPESWTNPALSTCDELTPDGMPGDIITDFREA